MEQPPPAEQQRGGRGDGAVPQPRAGRPADSEEGALHGDARGHRGAVAGGHVAVAAEGAVGLVFSTEKCQKRYSNS